MPPTLTTGGPGRSATPLVVTWVGAVLALGLLLILARSARGPLDDHDPAWQRPGFLDAGDLPLPAPAVTPNIPERGRLAVVFFVRSDGLAELCRALAESSLDDRAATAVVVAGAPSARCDAAEVVVGDTEGSLAAAYGMRRPRGGGPPVGYSVVDTAGAIRYRTLDPEVAGQIDEVGTIVAALA